jgi:hypothetical protein
MATFYSVMEFLRTGSVIPERYPPTMLESPDGPCAGYSTPTIGQSLVVLPSIAVVAYSRAAACASGTVCYCSSQ